MIVTAYLTLLLAAPLAAVSPEVTEPPPMPTAEQWTRLGAGEVLVESWNDERDGGGGMVRAIMAATPAEVIAVVRSCRSAYRFVDGLEACELTSLGPGYDRVRQEVRRYWFTPTMAYSFDIREVDEGWVRFQLHEGSLDDLFGDWSFRAIPEDGATLVTHRVHLDPSWAAPGWMVRNTLTGDLPDMLACIRALAGGSLQNAEADARRCPGEAEGGDQ